jgi:hypothetical protein
VIDVFPFYERLWRRAQRDGVFVHYRGIMLNGEAGYFASRHTEGRKPEIAIARPYYANDDTPARERIAGAPMPAPDLVEELITLAHEYGHWQSYSGRTLRYDWERYFATAKKRDAVSARVDGAAQRDALRVELNDDDRERIVREETMAWVIAREVLSELALDDDEFWAAFERHAKQGLHNHRYRLGLDELWPGDK